MQKANGPGLMIFLEDGRVEIDNNLVERRHPPDRYWKKELDVHRRQRRRETEEPSYTQSSKVAAASRSTPFAYLREVLTRLPSMTNQQIAEILPAAWAKAQIKSLKAAS